MCRIFYEVLYLQDKFDKLQLTNEFTYRENID